MTPGEGSQTHVFGVHEDCFCIVRELVLIPMSQVGHSGAREVRCGGSPSAVGAVLSTWAGSFPRIKDSRHHVGRCVNGGWMPPPLGLLQNFLRTLETAFVEMERAREDESTNIRANVQERAKCGTEVCAGMSRDGAWVNKGAKAAHVTYISGVTLVRSRLDESLLEDRLQRVSLRSLYLNCCLRNILMWQTCSGFLGFWVVHTPPWGRKIRYSESSSGPRYMHHSECHCCPTTSIPIGMPSARHANTGVMCHTRGSYKSIDACGSVSQG